MLGSMKTPCEIIDWIGPEVVMAAMNVQDRRIRQARLEPQMPASWFHTMEELAGRPLPRSAFAFKGRTPTAR